MGRIALMVADVWGKQVGWNQTGGCGSEKVVTDLGMGVFHIGSP